jgi:hypothetical protein
MDAAQPGVVSDSAPTAAAAGGRVEGLVVAAVVVAQKEADGPPWWCSAGGAAGVGADHGAGKVAARVLAVDCSMQGQGVWVTVPKAAGAAPAVAAVYERRSWSLWTTC